MTKQGYFQYVPLSYPRIVRQTDADSIFALYGDKAGRGYSDDGPKDGIDDPRRRLLDSLAVRFAPFMIKNTGNVPMDMQKTQQISGATVLTIDRWDIHAAPRLLGSATVDFGKLASQPCPAEALSPNALQQLLRAETPLEDCRALQLLREFNPNHPLNARFNTAAVEPNLDPFSVLYWNWPGVGPASWKAAFESPHTGQLLEKYQDAISVYAHPFISEVQVPGDRTPHYEFIIQYWFFYPYNDAGNKHEGDWEHINVVVSPRTQVEAPQTAEQVRAVLERGSDQLDGEDPLVIRRVDYYFHENIMPVDYGQPNAYATREEWRRQFKLMPRERIGLKQIAAQIRFRAWADEAETKVNTHPIGYIGANSKGLDLFLYSPGAHNQNGHGTYPFQGLWENIGPAAAAEEVKRQFDHQAYLSGKAPLPSFVVAFDRPERIKLLPDWERVYQEVYVDPDYRREWAWLLLPIRSGYPAAASPFAGIISHAETGNLAPFTVTYNGGWNRNGAAGGYHLYDPHRLDGVILPSPLDQVQNNLGYLNAPIVALITLPPIDFIYKVLLIPVRRIVDKFPIQYYPKTELPLRVASVAGGVTTEDLEDEWAALLFDDQNVSEILSRFAAVDTAASGPLTPVVDNATSYAVQFSFYLGKRWATENIFHNSRSGLAVEVPVASRPNDPFTVSGTLALYELASSIRFNLFTGGLQPYLKLGYGWTWYRVEAVSTDGDPLPDPDTPWIDQPSFFPAENLWPNTTGYGVGLEWFLLRSNAPLPRGADLSLKGEWATYHNDLGISLQDAANLGFSSQPSASTQTVTVAGVISF